VAAAQAAASGMTGDVSIGMSAGAWYGVGDLFAEIRSRRPGLRLHVRQQSTRPIMAAVGRGELDIAVGLCVSDVPEGLCAHRLKDVPVVLVLAADHRLAGRASAPLDAVRGEVFALDEPEEGGDYNEAVLALCAANGFDPEVREVQTHHDAWESSIAAGECVGLTTASSLHAAHAGVAAIPLEPEAAFPLDLLWRRPGGEEPRPAVQAVLEIAGARV
jgi:DNA-binding transcriptional LysR family regulator